MSKDDTSKLLDLFNNPEFDAKRKADNLELLKILSELVYKYPSLRFSQILLIYGFVKQCRPQKSDPSRPADWQDEFYTEPGDILKRVQRRISNDTENS